MNRICEVVGETTYKGEKYGDLSICRLNYNNSDINSIANIINSIADQIEEAINGEQGNLKFGGFRITVYDETGIIINAFDASAIRTTKEIIEGFSL